MKIDIHVTTCHKSSLVCRPRPQDAGTTRWNARPWTLEERLEISKISLESIRRFVDKTVSLGHDVRFTILDDGTDTEEGINWLDSIDFAEVKRFPNRGSSAGINDHFKTIPENTDLVLHLEDDQIVFDPFWSNWAEFAWRALKLNKSNIKSITFKNGLPSTPDNPGYVGSWGPLGSEKINGLEVIKFRCLGNPHHVFLYEDYKKLFPQQGNSGSNEYYLNSKLNEFGWLNGELQIPLFFFHSHLLEYPVPHIPSTKEMNLSGVWMGIWY